MIEAPTPAGWKPRTLAGLIDCGIVVGYIVVLGMLIALVFPLLTGPTPLWASALLAVLFIEVPIGVWWWRQESQFGVTIGKRFEGIRVVAMGSDLKASARRCALRTCGKMLPWAIAHVLTLIAADASMIDQWWWSVPALTLVVTLGIISVVVSYFRMDHRTAYDLLAGTQVIAQG